MEIIESQHMLPVFNFTVLENKRLRLVILVCMYQYVPYAFLVSGVRTLRDKLFINEYYRLTF